MRIDYTNHAARNSEFFSDDDLEPSKTSTSSQPFEDETSFEDEGLGTSAKNADEQAYLLIFC